MPPSAPDPFSACVRGISATMEVRVATWNINGLFVAAGYVRDRYRGKLRMLRALVDTSDVVTLQETHGHAADLSELLKMFPDCLGMGTFADSRNAGGTIVLLLRSLSPRLSLLFRTRSRVAGRFAS